MGLSGHTLGRDNGFCPGTITGMDMGHLSELMSFRWWFRKDNERVFEIPDTSKDGDEIPPAVVRHLLVIKDAMSKENTKEVGNRQRRLAKLGIEVPTKPSHVEDMLRKYNATESNR